MLDLFDIDFSAEKSSSLTELKNLLEEDLTALSDTIKTIPPHEEWGYYVLSEFAQYLGARVTEESSEIFIALLEHPNWYIREGAVFGLDDFLTARFLGDCEESEDDDKLPVDVIESLRLFNEDVATLREQKLMLIDTYLS